MHLFQRSLFACFALLLLAACERAPYLGVVWNRKLGDTADFARADGEGVADTRLVAGIRF